MVLITDIQGAIVKLQKFDYFADTEKFFLKREWAKLKVGERMDGAHKYATVARYLLSRETSRYCYEKSPFLHIFGFYDEIQGWQSC